MCKATNNCRRSLRLSRGHSARPSIPSNNRSRLFFCQTCVAADLRALKPALDGSTRASVSGHQAERMLNSRACTATPAARVGPALRRLPSNLSLPCSRRFDACTYGRNACKSELVELWNNVSGLPGTAWPTRFWVSEKPAIGPFARAESEHGTRAEAHRGQQRAQAARTRVWVAAGCTHGRRPAGFHRRLNGAWWGYMRHLQLHLGGF